MRPTTDHQQGVVPLISSDGLTAAGGMLRFEYVESGPNCISGLPAPEHNLIVNFGSDALHIAHRRNDSPHKILLPPGGIIATPAGTRTSWKWTQPAKIGLIWVDPGKMQDFLETRVGVFFQRDRLRDRIVFDNRDIFSIAQRLKQTVTYPEIGADVMIDALSRALVVCMLRQRRADIDARAPGTGDLGHARFRQIVHTVRQNLDGRLTLDDLSRIAGMSRSHFAQSFKALTGRTPMQFVMDQRLQAARDLLARSRLTISQIAIRCGFADQAHLTHKFKTAFQQTPGQYRKGHQVVKNTNARPPATAGSRAPGRH